MASRDLRSVNNYLGSKNLANVGANRWNLSNRLRSSPGTDFKNILSSFQVQVSKNTFKTNGLTIVDYRARPVISKSRYAPQTKLKLSELKNLNSNRIADHWPSLPMEKDTLKTQSPSVQKRKTLVYAKQQIHKSDQTQVGLTEQQIIEKNIQKAAARYNLSPALIKGVIRAESNFKVRAVSSAGAQGLMQLMPATAKELGVKNPFDIEQNIDGGTKYLKKMLDRFGGDVRLALAAYNAGPGTVKKYGGHIPYPETQLYVQRVLRFSEQIA